MFTRFIFSPDTGVGEGGGESKEPQESQEPQEQQEPQDQGKTFTQADVDKMMADRLSKQEKSFLKKFGFEDTGKMGEALKQFKELQESQMSEVEKAKKRAEELEAELGTLRETATKAEIKSEALALGVDPEKLETVLKLAPAYDGETAADKIKALLEEVPGLKKAEKGPEFGGASGNKSPDAKETTLQNIYKAAGISL